MLRKGKMKTVYLAGGSDSFFPSLGHEIGKITEVSLVWIFIIGFALHFLVASRAGTPALYYVGAAIMGLLAGVAFPVISRWFSHLGSGGRGSFDIVIVIVVLSEFALQIFGRVASLGGRGGE
jgi:hypothetical protein